MQTVPSQHHFRSSWPLLLSVLLMIGLAVLGALSLRQHRQLQQLKTQRQKEWDHQLQTDAQLATELARLRRELPLHLGAHRSDNHAPPSDNDLSSAKLLEQIGALEQRTCQTSRQLDEITALLCVEKTIQQLSGGVCLILGEYGFVDPQTDLPLRYLDESNSAENNHSVLSLGVTDTADQDTFSPVSVTGKGEPLTVQFTGTGFLVDKRGYILTNRHVTVPWEIAHQYAHVLAAGYQGRLHLFQAYFPAHRQPFQLKVMTSSTADDVALLFADLSQAQLEPLPCAAQSETLQTGQTVIVLGYPTGFEGLLARMSTSELEAILVLGGGTFQGVAQAMAHQGLIQPIATRGMCGRATGGRIVYDAPTAIGGSGGPVVNAQGKVAAINTALMKNFTGGNFGVPIEKGLALFGKIVP